jgi:tetratricopeptide (TPR) repeat protein
MKPHLSFVTALGISLFGSCIAADAQQGVRAESGAIAIGGNVTGSTVIIGIPQEKVDDLVRDAKRPLEELTWQQRENIALLKEKLDLNERQVRAALGILGENDVPPERLAAKLVEVAERFKDLQATASAQPGDNSRIVSLKADAQKAIAEGDLAEADVLLAEVEMEQRRGLDRLARNAAETSARRGEIALTRLRYVEADQHFANAATVFPLDSAHEEKRTNYLQSEARSLFYQGSELGDNDALRSAKQRYRGLIELTRRERVPLEWAKTQSNLGNSFLALGQHEGRTDMLEQAIPAYRAALQERTRERAPLEWAMTHSNLANALQSAARHEIGTGKVEEAVVAYREALKEQTRERKPLNWAAIQHNLGNALQVLGERESGTTKLEEAITAYRAALQERTRERMPLEWAMTQDAIGNTLLALAQRERDTEKLEQAIAAHREALKERTRERVPLEWASSQHNLGNALQFLGRREIGTANLEEAVNAYRAALSERTRERVPLDWAWSSGNQGVALIVIADRQSDAAMAETAVDQISAAMETLRNGGHAAGAARFERALPWARAVVTWMRGR